MNPYGIDPETIPAVLYHGTTKDAWEAIKRVGIQTDEDRGVPQPTDEEMDAIDFPYLWDGVWLTDSVDRAHDHGDVVIAVNSAALKDRVFEVWADDEYRDISVVGTIAPGLLLGASLS